ncbi:uncharacterized protein LOC116351466 [Contarinia nasturtii]|uniref:uncharacterized protein LOC116351466 n=1 Tax=Contarinia nasturtii TaxID=265458 RepID=UPI0012D4316B|nr:uncharacterized protein LOC116351466 [Contarinia nasturtii]
MNNQKSRLKRIDIIALEFGGYEVEHHPAPSEGQSRKRKHNASGNNIEYDALKIAAMKPLVPLKKLRLDDNQNSKLKSKLTLTDMPYDIFEPIFKRLNLIDLLSIADVSKYGRKMAQIYYWWKYRKSTVCITSHFTTNQRMYDINDGEIVIKDYKTTVDLFRCFGKMVKSLEVISFPKFQSILHHVKYIMMLHKISECLDLTLTKLKIQGDEKTVLSGLRTHWAWQLTINGKVTHDCLLNKLLLDPRNGN